MDRAESELKIVRTAEKHSTFPKYNERDKEIAGWEIQSRSKIALRSKIRYDDLDYVIQIHLEETNELENKQKIERQTLRDKHTLELHYINHPEMKRKEKKYGSS